MGARGDLRHHAAIGLVRAVLADHRLREDAPVATSPAPPRCRRTTTSRPRITVISRPALCLKARRCTRGEAMQGLRLGTRGSPLALAQARKVAAAIETSQRWPDGWVADRRDQDDRRQGPGPAAGRDRRQGAVDQGAGPRPARRRSRFLRPFDEGRRKRPAREIHIAAVRPRGDVRDRIIGAESIDKLKQGARVGTSSPRRAAQLRAASARPRDRADPRQCRNPAEEGRERRGRCDIAGFGGPEAPRNRCRNRHPDRDPPSRTGPGGDRHGVPHQRHAHPERADQREQPDHL